MSEVPLAAPGSNEHVLVLLQSIAAKLLAHWHKEAAKHREGEYI